MPKALYISNDDIYPGGGGMKKILVCEDRDFFNNGEDKHNDNLLIITAIIHKPIDQPIIQPVDNQVGHHVGPPFMRTGRSDY